MFGAEEEHTYQETAQLGWGIGGQLPGEQGPGREEGGAAESERRKVTCQVVAERPQSWGPWSF